MKFGSISSSQLGKYDRMDPGFHLAVQSVEAQVATLEKTMEASALVDQLMKLSIGDLGEPLEPLLTGQQAKTARAHLNTAIEKYPFIAYALVLKYKEQMLAKAKERLATEQGYLQTLEAIGKDLGT